MRNKHLGSYGMKKTPGAKKAGKKMTYGSDTTSKKMRSVKKRAKKARGLR